MTPPVVPSSNPVPVPDLIRHQVLSSYSVDPNSTMFIYPEKPNRVYIVREGRINFVDVTYGTAFPQSAAVLPYPVKRSHEVEAPPSMRTQPKHLGNRSSQLNIPSNAYGDRRRWNAETDGEQSEVLQEKRQTNVYKTALCTEYRDFGTCSYGVGCRFAHDVAELRLPPQTHPKFKTQLCNKFALFGYCPYGASCHFIHRHSDSLRANTNPVVRYPSEVQSPISAAPSTALICRNLPRKSTPLQSGLMNRRAALSEMVSSASSNQQNGIRFGGSLSNFHMQRTIFSQDIASNFSHAQTIAGNGEDVEVASEWHSSAQNGVESAVEGSTDRGNTPGIESINKLLDDWLLEDSKDVFAQSCFPRIQVERL